MTEFRCLEDRDELGLQVALGIWAPQLLVLLQSCTDLSQVLLGLQSCCMDLSQVHILLGVQALLLLLESLLRSIGLALMEGALLWECSERGPFWVSPPSWPSWPATCRLGLGPPDWPPWPWSLLPCGEWGRCLALPLSLSIPLKPPFRLLPLPKHPEGLPPPLPKGWLQPFPLIP